MPARPVDTPGNTGSLRTRARAPARDRCRRRKIRPHEVGRSRSCRPSPLESDEAVSSLTGGRAGRAWRGRRRRWACAQSGPADAGGGQALEREPEQRERGALAIALVAVRGQVVVGDVALAIPEHHAQRVGARRGAEREEAGDRQLAAKGGARQRGQAADLVARAQVLVKRAPVVEPAQRIGAVLDRQVSRARNAGGGR